MVPYSESATLGHLSMAIQCGGARSTLATLFHASNDILSDMAWLAPRGLRFDTPGKAEFEERLKACAPSGFPDRTCCLFAFEEPGFAADYLEARSRKGGALHLYEVEADSYSKHPMAMIDFAYKHLSHKVFGDIAREYWTPQMNWSAMECLCSKIRVIQEAVWPSRNDIGIARAKYMQDIDRAKSAFRRRDEGDRPGRTV